MALAAHGQLPPPPRVRGRGERGVPEVAVEDRDRRGGASERLRGGKRADGSALDKRRGGRGAIATPEDRDLPRGRAGRGGDLRESARGDT